MHLQPPAAAFPTLPHLAALESRPHEAACEVLVDLGRV